MEEKKLFKMKSRAITEGNVKLLATVYRKIAELRVSEGRYEEALDAYKEEEKTCEELGDIFEVARANRGIGEVFCSMGEYEEALRYLKKYLELARVDNNLIEEQRALATIGRTYFCLAESVADTNEEHFRRALRDAKQANILSLQICDRLHGISRVELMQMRSRLMLNMGLIMECQGDTAKGIDHIEKAIAITEKADLFEDTHRCYSSLASLYRKENQIVMALKYCDLALEVAERLPDKLELNKEILLFKAEVYFSQANYQPAKQVLVTAYKCLTPYETNRELIEKYLKIAIVLCDSEETLLKTPDSDFQTMKKLYEKMGDACCLVRNFDKALTYYHKTLECAEALGDSNSQLLPIYISLAQTYKDNEQYEEALEYYNKELDLHENNPAEACTTVTNIIQVKTLQHTTSTELEDMYNQAYELAIKAENIKLQVTVLESWLDMRKTYGETELAAEIERKLKSLAKYVEESGSSENEDPETQDITANVTLDTILDEPEDECNRSRMPRNHKQVLKMKRNPKGETPLHEACEKGKLNFVKKYLELGHPVNVQDYGGWSPLQDASNGGFYDIVELLLDHGADINYREGKECKGVTALHDAASVGHLRIAELLLDRGALIDLRTDDNKTPLDCLLEWKSRQENIAPEEFSLFLSIQERLKKALDRAGVSTTATTDMPDMSTNMMARAPSPVLRTRAHKPVNSASAKKRVDYRSMKQDLRRTVNDSCEVDRKRYRVISSGSSSDSDNDVSVLPSRTLPSLNDRSSISRSDMSIVRNNTGEYTSQSVSHDMNSDSIAAQAVEEYRGSIAGLRNRHLQETPNRVCDLSGRSHHFGPYLQEDEVGDDWLVDDSVNVSRSNKRRKTRNEFEISGLEFIGTSGLRQCNPSDVNESSSTATPSLTNDYNNDNYNIEDTFARSPENVGTASNSIRLPAVSHSSSGISQVVTEVALHHTRTTQESSRSGAMDSRVASGIQTVKVRVENKLLLVPLQDSPHLTIGWLVEQVAQRYYKLEGMTPTLSLLTRDGAALAEDDPLSVVLDSDEILASVASWNIPALTQRYADICKNMNSVMDTHILSCLQTCEASQCLCLENLALPQHALSVVLQTLKHQHGLQQLNLAGNILTDKGAELLADCVKKMQCLEVLNLSCTDISSKGVNFITALVSPSAPVLQALVVLDLSHNPLGNDCMSHVHNLLKTLDSLQTLRLQSCGLTSTGLTAQDNANPALSYVSNLSELDISYNMLEPGSIMGFLCHLNPDRVISLNLAGTVGRGSPVSQIVSFLEKEPQNLSRLDLSDCNVTDPDVFQILRCLAKATKLESLNLCNNMHLSSVSLRRLIQHQPSPSRIDLLGCYNILRYLDESAQWLWRNSGCQPAKKFDVFISLKSGKDQQIELECINKMWRNAWGVHGIVRKGPGGLLHLSVINHQMELK